MSSVRFNLKRKNAERRTVVMAIIRHRRAKYAYSTGVSVEPSDWDARRERSKTDEAMNTSLSSLRKKILAIISEKDRLPTKAEIEKNDKPEAERKKIIEAMIERGEDLYNMRQSKNTRQHYRSLASNIGLFTKEKKRKEVYIDEITPRYITSYSGWLNEKGRKISTITKNMTLLMLVVKQFGEKEQSKGVKAPPVVYSDQVYLTPEEIQRLETHPFEPGSTDDICRDLFLCAYYTALRSCDWKQIRTSQIEILEGKKMLKVAQQKTKKKALIPVNPKLWAILKKHGGSTLKQYSQQFLNRNIKDICRRCGITDPVSIAEYRKGKITQIEGPKYQFVSSHTARRSFATNAVQAGIPATDVMRFTGHSTMAAFMQYIRTTREETALKYADHEFFGRIIAVPEKELTEEILKARQSAAAEFAGMLTSPPELDPEEMEWAGIA